MRTSGRTFERTHPWIQFRLDLQRANFQLWINLGEATSKCDHIAGVPLSPETAQKLHNFFLAKGAAATTAIEGNTLTENEVLSHLEGTLQLPASKEYLKQEIDNILTAYKEITDDLRAGDVALSVARICNYNKIVLNHLAVAEEVTPGKIRTYSVGVGNVYKGAPPEDCEYLLSKLCDWLNGPDFVARPGMEIAFGVLKAIVAHLYLAWIHPFGDGNGRTARLVELQILLAVHVPTPAAHLLSNHYNQTRSEYYRQLDRASKSGGDPLPFIEYAVAGFVDGLSEQLQMIREEHWNTVWRNHIHEMFRDKKTESDTRQRQLALDLSNTKDSIPLSKITEVSARIARAYAHKTTKTISRDLLILEQLGLIQRTPQGVRARREAILAFLPWRRGR